MDQLIYKFTCIQFSGADVFFFPYVSQFKVLEPSLHVVVNASRQIGNWKPKSKVLGKSLQKCPYSLHESLEKRYCAKRLVSQLQMCDTIIMECQGQCRFTDQLLRVGEWFTKRVDRVSALQTFNQSIRAVFLVVIITGIHYHQDTEVDKVDKSYQLGM